MSDIRIYFWGKTNSYNQGVTTYQWLRAGYSPVGGINDQASLDSGFTGQHGLPAGQYVIHFPTTYISSLSPGRFVSHTSDESAGSVYQYSSIPIVIVNASNDTLEEVNISIGSHLWGNNGSEGGFVDFWSDFKDARDDNQNLYFQDAGQQYYKDSNMSSTTNMQKQSHSSASPDPPHSRNDINTGDLAYFAGAGRGNQPNLDTPYDTYGSFWRTSPTQVYNRQSIGFSPVEYVPPALPYGGGAWEINTNWESNLLGVFGDPSSSSSAHWRRGAAPTYLPYYYDYKSAFPAGGRTACVLDYDVLQDLGQRWVDHAGNTTSNVFGRKTLQRTSNPLFGGTSCPTGDWSVWSPNRFMRGFLVSKVLASNWNQTEDIGSNEGRIFGKYFATVIVTARYY